MSSSTQDLRGNIHQGSAVQRAQSHLELDAQQKQIQQTVIESLNALNKNVDGVALLQESGLL